MTKKILKSIGIIILLILLLIGFFIYNTSTQYKKLRQGVLNEDFTCDTIPFTYTRSGHILIKTKINNSSDEYLFILDSGAKNFLFQSFTKDHNFESNGFAIAMGASKNIFFTKIKKINSVQLGDAKFNNINAEETDLNFDCSEDICGIIGTGIMRHLVWEINFQKQIIIISKQLDKHNIDNCAIKIPLNENKYSHHLRAQIKFRKNKKTKTVLIDLGNNSTLSLDEDLLLKDSLNLKHKQIFGIGSKGLGNKRNNKTLDSKYYLLDSLIFSNSYYFVNNIPVETNLQSLNLLGLDFFNKYKIIISWKDEKLILIPNDSIQKFIWKTYGFSTAYNKKLDKVEIQSIIENSPASEAGLELDLNIVSINNKPFFDSLSYCDYKEIKQKSDSISLGIRLNDTIKTFKLAKDLIFK